MAKTLSFLENRSKSQSIQTVRFLEQIFTHSRGQCYAHRFGDFSYLFGVTVGNLMQTTDSIIKQSYRLQSTTVVDLKALSGDLKVTNRKVYVQQFHNRRICGFEAMCGHIIKYHMR